MKLVSFAIATCELLIVAGAAAAELHPIVEVQSGYLFGATADGKWIKSEEAAKAISGQKDVRNLRIDPVTRPSQGRQAEAGGRGSVFRRVDSFALAKSGQRRDRTCCTVECVTAKGA